MPENPYQSPASPTPLPDLEPEQDEWEQREGSLWSLTNREQAVVDLVLVTMLVTIYAVIVGVAIFCEVLSH